MTGRHRRAGRAALLLALLTLAPAVAHACPVCFDPRAENRFAFLATTIFLTLLPLGLVAGTLLWVRYHWNMFAAEQVAAEQVAAEQVAAEQVAAEPVAAEVEAEA